MGRQQQSAQQETTSRPKRRATNSYIFRYLQTRNPSRLEENDLKRALDASLEECPDFWPDDSASIGSSEQSNLTSATSSTSSPRSNSCGPTVDPVVSRPVVQKKKRTKSSMQPNHLSNHPCNCYHHSHHRSQTASPATIHNFCPLSTVHNRYKPVVKKNIYNEADFFHDGIMEYIEYELSRLKDKRANSNK